MSAPLAAQAHYSTSYLRWFCRALAGRSQPCGGQCSHHAGAAMGRPCATRGTAAGQLPGELCYQPVCPLHPGSCMRSALGTCCCHIKRCSCSEGTTTGACYCCRLSCHAEKRRGHSWHAPAAARALRCSCQPHSGSSTLPAAKQQPQQPAPRSSIFPRMVSQQHLQQQQAMQHHASSAGWAAPARQAAADRGHRSAAGAR